MLRISSPFGDRFHPILKDDKGKPLKKFHNGIDLIGDEKYVMLNTDKILGFSVDKDDINGNKIRVHLHGGYLLIICHLEYISKHIVEALKSTDKGVSLKKLNEPLFLGKMGTTGRSTGIHYHISIYRIKDSKYLNPDPTYKNLLTFEV